jgi:hypothetical protein
VRPIGRVPDGSADGSDHAPAFFGVLSAVGGLLLVVFGLFALSFNGQLYPNLVAVAIFGFATVILRFLSGLIILADLMTAISRRGAASPAGWGVGAGLPISITGVVAAWVAGLVLVLSSVRNRTRVD